MMTKSKKTELSVPFYSIFYKPTGSSKWVELENVTSDGYIEDLPIRYFITLDNNRHEVCALHHQFWFKEDRNKAISSAQTPEKRSKPRLAIS
jgi:hypothetical protein